MDPVSLTATVVGFAETAFTVGKALYNFIETYRQACDIFEELYSDLDGLNSVLASLRDIGGQDRGASYSQLQCACLKEIDPALQNCTAGFSAFKNKVEKLMSKSTPEHVSKRDKFMLHFKMNDIEAFRIQLGNYKSTLTIGLLVVSLKSTSSQQQQIAEKVESTIGLLTGQMEGLKLASQAVEDAGARHESLATSLAQAIEAVSQCGQVCKAAGESSAAAVPGGSVFKSIEGFDKARFLVGHTNKSAIAGGPSMQVEKLVGRGQSKFVIGNMDASTALEYMKD